MVVVVEAVEAVAAEGMVGMHEVAKVVGVVATRVQEKVAIKAMAKGTARAAASIVGRVVINAQKANKRPIGRRERRLDRITLQAQKRSDILSQISCAQERVPYFCTLNLLSTYA